MLPLLGFKRRRPININREGFLGHLKENRIKR
ncbi:hypothetical protein IMCC1933_30890 [Rhodobacteraceae bacterium IMCC1933]|nr:hypothetical protein [Rhodobacteraceae bacterium IMCC1923]MDP4066459.1 hypothetical protein [Rhodobacteraceae bacterium IMCC1923]MDP4069517.1 hypothetical protein [Rhodobacteraceae bacterium IMCC1933]MDP4072620.1 hypothetical protein [Rhodobacteraceae bacterium IMCC1909]